MADWREKVAKKRQEPGVWAPIPRQDKFFCNFLKPDVLVSLKGTILRELAPSGFLEIHPIMGKLAHLSEIPRIRNIF